MLWDLSKEGKEQYQTFGLGHSRIVFNISCDVAGTRIMTVSMDRQVKHMFMLMRYLKNLLMLLVLLLLKVKGHLF